MKNCGLYKEFYLTDNIQNIVEKSYREVSHISNLKKGKLNYNLLTLAPVLKVKTIHCSAWLLVD